MHALAIPFRVVKGWKFWYDPKWQRSSILSVAVWVASTKVIFHFAHWGPGWMVIITIGLMFETLMWCMKKLFIWAKQSVAVRASISKSWLTWLLLTGLNFGLTLMLNTAGDLNTHYTRYAMIPFGLLINPIRFHLDNAVIFGDTTLPQLGREVRSRAEVEATFVYLYMRGITRTLV